MLLPALFKTIKSIPGVSSIINKEKGKAIEKMKLELKESVPADFPARVEIPTTGVPKDALREYIARINKFETDHYESVKTSGCIYTCNKDAEEVVGDTVKAFLFTNPLHSETFPVVRRMEAEVIKMVAHMLHGDDRVCGMMTTGGTESIFLAMLAYRNKAISEGKDPERIEILLDKAAHVGYYKAAYYLRMNVREFSMDTHMRGDIGSLVKSITEDTVVIIGSAPGYPYGVIDDIVKMGEVARKFGVGLHVDGCLGGFVLPFIELNGHHVPLWDFRVPGVTSISCDTHKYGYAPKGTSVLLFRERELRRHTFFAAQDWTGGMYSTPSLPGSRSGANIAGAWASMVYRGVDGYSRAAEGIYSTAREIVASIKKLPEVELLGDPVNTTFVVPFTTKGVDIYRVAKCMQSHGWDLNTLQFPSALHICVTEQHVGLAQKFVEALKQSIEDVRNGVSIAQKLPLYSLAVMVPDRSIIEGIVVDVIESYLDVC